MSTNEEDMKRLETKERKDQLYALLRVYDVFKDLIELYCEDVSHPPKELNVLYIRELVPTIKSLVTGLNMQPEGNSNIKLPAPYIPFEDLFTAEKACRGNNQSPEVVMMEINNVYGTIKVLAERVGAIGLPLSPKIEALLKEASRLMQEEYQRRHNHVSDKHQKIRLADYDVNFIEEESAIYVGEGVCKIPANTKLFYFAKVIWQHRIGQVVPWETLLDEIEEIGPKEHIDNKQKNIMDRMYRLNDLVRELTNTDDDLFTRSNDTIKRNF